MNMNILKEIKKQGYANIFWQVDNKILNELWANGNHKTELQKIWQNEEEDLQVRLIAAEILFKKDKSFAEVDKKTKVLLANLYAAALANKGTINGNIWGLPEFTGQAGEHLLQTDKEEIIRLLKLLLSNTQPLIYVGSKEATYANEYLYRVKDLAAYYLSKLLKLKYKILKSPSMRDEQIKKIFQIT
jgi:hypothetical protein